MGAVIAGSGVSVPPAVVTNDDLARIMDTSDEWIRSRTGVARRHIAEPGVGSAQLGTEATLAALADAGLGPDDVDALISATMTPDHFAPGNATLIQDRAGLGPIAAYEIRQQCGGFLYGLDLADALLSSDRADTVVVVGAEVHRGYMPFGASFEILFGRSDLPPTREDYDRATASRAWSVLFGDGAGAMVLRRGADGDGVLASSLHSDGSLFELIHVPGLGFVHQPYASVEQIEAELHMPQMNGGELFRQAVRKMPESLRAVLEETSTSLEDLDLVIAHQANQRILDGVARQLDAPAGLIASNVADYGNTTAATLPLLYADCRRAGRTGPGALIAFTAFGAGAHWGATLYREPSTAS